jgi:hypothetical protein
MIPAKKESFSNKVLFVDGMPGCGKTLFSTFIAAYPRVELLTYAYDIEQVCGLYYLDEISFEGAATFVNLSVDQKTYHGMMCRETNFRPSDLSSVFSTPRKSRYFKRLFMKGDHAVPKRIMEEDPILNLTSHSLLSFSLPIFKALSDRVTFIEIIRHPLYQIRQHYLNTNNLFDSDPRSLTMSYRTNAGEIIPYFVKEYEEDWVRGNAMDKAILSMHYWGRRRESILAENQMVRSKTVIIPFEKFVFDPDCYLEIIEKAIGLQRTSLVKRALAKQNVPRKRIAAGINLAVYERCGWTPPVNGTEKDELLVRFEDAKREASPNILELLREMSENYEKEHMQGIL